MPRNTSGCLTYMDADADRIWPCVRRRPSRLGATGVQVGRTTTKVMRPTRIVQERHQCRVAEQQDEAARSPLDGAAEEVGRAGAHRRARRLARHSFGPASPRPRDRLRPLGLQIRPGRPVEERSSELAPPPLEVDPREGGHRRGSVARDRRHRRAQLAVRASVSSQPTPASAELPR